MRTSPLPLFPRRWAFMALLPVLASCGEPPPPAVQVGPVAYSEDQLLGFSGARRETLGVLTAFGLAVADSATAELGSPVTGEWIDDRLLEILAAETVLADAGVGDAVLEARYLTDPEYELTVRHILFFSERWRVESHRAEAREKAERALELLRGGADFAETAARLSEEPGAEGRQGLLRPGREGAWVDEFWAAASALEVGEISPVTETQYGYHILRLENREVVPFEEGRSRVAREVAHQVGDPTEYLQGWEDPRARAAALEEADAMGLSVPEAEAEELRRRWTDTTTRWAAALGFAAGMTPEQVAEAALAALAATAQGAAIARDELGGHAELIHERYRIRIGPGP